MSGEGRVSSFPLWSIHSLKNDFVSFLHLIALSVSSGLLLAGCTTPPPPTAAQTDWQTICAEAPYGPGQALTPKVQRALARQDPQWKLSVEAINQRCPTP